MVTTVAALVLPSSQHSKTLMHPDVGVADGLNIHEIPDPRQNDFLFCKEQRLHHEKEVLI